METTVMQDSKEAVFFDNLQAAFGQLNESAGADVRLQAKENLSKLTFPTRKTEYWKYTPVNKVVNQQYHFSKVNFEDRDFIKKNLIPDLDCYKLVFVNGFFQAYLSDKISENGVKVQSLAAALKENDDIAKYLTKQTDLENRIFAMMNSSYFTDGLFVQIEKNIILDKPIHLLQITYGENVISLPRNLIIAESGAAAKFIESFVTTENTSTTLTNSQTEIFIAENAAVEWNKLQWQAENNNFQISTDTIYQNADSKVSTNTYSLSGSLVRNNLNFEVEGENCETHLYGYYMPKGEMLIDNHTIVNHRKAHCESNELYKGVLSDKSKGVFNGRVLVCKDSQKIDAYQSNANILLSDTAQINTKPELEIYADDVKCSHGSATGQMDEEAMFYLQSRGISADNATKLLLTAYAADVLNNLTIEPLRIFLEEKIAGQLV